MYVRLDPVIVCVMFGMEAIPLLGSGIFTIPEIGQIIFIDIAVIEESAVPDDELRIFELSSLYKSKITFGLCEYIKEIVFR